MGLHLHELVFSAAEAELGGGFNGMYAIAALDALDEMISARVVLRRIEYSCPVNGTDG